MTNEGLTKGEGLSILYFIERSMKLRIFEFPHQWERALSVFLTERCSRPRQEISSSVGATGSKRQQRQDSLHLAALKTSRRASTWLL